MATWKLPIGRYGIGVGFLHLATVRQGLEPVVDYKLVVEEEFVSLQFLFLQQYHLAFCRQTFRYRKYRLDGCRLCHRVFSNFFKTGCQRIRQITIRRLSLVRFQARKIGLTLRLIIISHRECILPMIREPMFQCFRKKDHKSRFQPNSVQISRHLILPEARLFPACGGLLNFLCHQIQELRLILCLRIGNLNRGLSGRNWHNGNHSTSILPSTLSIGPSGSPNFTIHRRSMQAAALL